MEVVKDCYQLAVMFPKSRWLKQNLPNGVMKVTRRADSFASGTCQKPEFTSSFVKLEPLLAVL